jgi:hypothetical protein
LRPPLIRSNIGLASGEICSVVRIAVRLKEIEGVGGYCASE